MKRYSKKSFSFALIGGTAFIASLVFLLNLNADNVWVYAVLGGVLMLVSGVYSLMGLVKSIKGRKEKNTIQKIIGLILSAIFSVLFVLILIRSVFDTIFYVILK